MTFWQTVIAAGILLCVISAAIRDGRVPWLLASVLLGNFLATMALSPESPIALVELRDNRVIAAVDIISAAILVMGGRREMIVCALFVLMAPAYLVAHYHQLYQYAAYATIDAIALAQFVIVGWPGGGWRTHGNNSGKSGIAGGHSVDTRVWACRRPGISQTKGGQ